ncbi:hypothetical protein Sjap_020410 [Stephania japonica]|uniref:Uncharacterized protein n=1 Tax=Stephania japonica TaxID=461633 RepID=A0AAP0I093_9MAGN
MQCNPNTEQRMREERKKHGRRTEEKGNEEGQEETWVIDRRKREEIDQMKI